MRIFIKHILLFLLPVLLTGICLEILLRKIPNDYSLKSDCLNKESKTMRILFLGSSHVFFGINPVFVKDKSFNAANVSQSLKYDFEILNKYQWDSLRYIVVGVDYFSLNYELETGVESWRIKNYAIYYNIATTNAISDHSEIFSANLAVSLSKLYNYYIRHNAAISCSAMGYGTLDSTRPQQNLLTTGPEAAKRHTESNARDYSDNIKILRAIVEVAKAKNIKVVFFSCPAFKTYVQKLDSHQLNQMTEGISQIVNASKNAFYYNFLNDSAFKAEDYYDADHLNGQGAKKLTLKIDSLIHSAREKKATF